ncbi:MAG: O-antigen ligase family protein [Saccharofermentanales bacterium]
MIKKLAYISIMASLIGASVVSLDLKVFQLSLFRGLIILILMIFVIGVLIENTPLKLFKDGLNAFSVKFMLFWLLYSFFSLAWVKDDKEWLKAMYFIGIGVICILVFSSVLLDAKDFMTAFRLFSVMILFHNVVGWYEVLTGNYLLANNLQAKFAANRNPVTSFTNTNDFATLMAMSFFVLLICFANSRRLADRAFFTVLAASSVLLLIKTDSRANMIGLALGLAVFLLLFVRSSRYKKYIFSGLLVPGIILTLSPGVIDLISKLITSLLTLDFASGNGSDSVRINLLKNGALFLVRTFGFGTGAGNGEFWMNRYSQFYTAGNSNMHNWWMEILTEYGVLVFSLYLVFYLKLARDLFRFMKQSNSAEDRNIARGMLCAMATFILASISSSSIMPAEWLWVFWAIAIAFQGYMDSRKRDECVLQTALDGDA